MPDLSHTPGIYYALAYWLSCTFYIAQLPRRLGGWRLAAVQTGCFAAISAFMIATDGVPMVWFIPCVCVYVGLMLLDIKLCCGLDWLKTGYIFIRCFILGEFAAALEWQMFYFGLTALGLPLRMWVNLLFLLISHGAVFGVMFLLERKYRLDYQMDFTWREFASAVVLCLMVFAASNLSYVSQNTPFSSRFTSEIFIIRTLVDLGGVAILHAYHVQLQALSTRLEMAGLQNLLQLQYNNYRISEDSMALVNQKYHDLKHHIQLLRAGVTSQEKLEYLDQMEQEIRSYEAQNKTGSRVLDAILTAKSLQCQREGITLTCVADGQALDFMHPMDLSALFGNALDNAMESVRKLSDPDMRLIHLSVARQKGFLRIRVENCYEGDLDLKSGMPASTKQDKRYHGFGLKSIQAIAAKYGGSVTIGSKDGWFELRILFPLSGGQDEEAPHGDHKQN
jgi:hypothetical protein